MALRPARIKKNLKLSEMFNSEQIKIWHEIINIEERARKEASYKYKAYSNELYKCNDSVAIAKSASPFPAASLI